MTQSNTDITVNVRTASLNVRYDSVLFPIDVVALLKLLPSRGWIVPEKEQGTDASVTLAKPVAKGGTQLRVGRGSNVIGVEGDDVEEVMERFRELLDAAADTADPETLGHVMFAEIRCVGTARGRANPIDSLAGFWSARAQTDEFARELRSGFPTVGDVAPYGLRFAPKAENPNQSDWAEISISPVAGSAPRWYHFDVIYRRKDISLVEEATSELRRSVARLIGCIEGSSA